MADPAGLMQNDDDNMKQTPKYSYITGGNENIYTLLYNWSANVVLSKEMERAYKEQSTILDPRCEILWWRPTALEDLNQTEPKEDMTKDFNGCENGETSLGGSYTTTYSPSRVFIKQDQKKLDRKHWWCYAREIVWLGYSESLFLRQKPLSEDGPVLKVPLKISIRKALKLPSTTIRLVLTRKDRKDQQIHGRIERLTSLQEW